MRIARPGRSIADAPIDRLGVLVVGAGHPGRPTAVFPIVTLPGVMPRFALSRNGEGPPELLAAIGIECGNVTANPELAAGTSHDDLAVDDQRHQGHVLALLVVLHL